MSKIPEKVEALAAPIAAEQNVTLWDVEYVKEAVGMVLRVYIDSEEGIGIDDCEAFSRALDPILDEADPIPDSYIFEVCSAGLERVLKRPGDFERFLGQAVTVKLYKPVDGVKEVVGQLTGYADGDVTVEAGGQSRTFLKNDVAQVRLYVEF